MGNSKKKLIKLLIITAIVGLVILGAVIGFITMKENASPEVVAAKLEQEKQENGYYMRVAELTDLMKQKSDSPATAIIDKICEVIGSTKINSIERGGVRGNYTFYIDNYVLEALIRGTNLDELRIGNSLIYKRIANTNDKSVIVTERIYTFIEYDVMVERLAKEMKVTKAVAARNFSLLNSLDILNFTDVKKLKSDEPGITRYKGISMNIPLEITLTGETISHINIVHEAVGTIEVYNKDSEAKEKQTIKSHIPVYGARKVLPEGLAYQVGKAMSDATGNTITIRFPIAIDSGDDSWLIIKNGNELYIEVKGEVIKSGGTESESFIMKRDTDINQLTYLKVGRKVYIGN